MGGERTSEVGGVVQPGVDDGLSWRYLGWNCVVGGRDVMRKGGVVEGMWWL